MFCYKCGTQAAEGAAFCQSCGAKLVFDTPIQPAPTPPQPAPVLAAPVKKKPKILPIIFGAAALVILIAIALIFFGTRKPKPQSPVSAQGVLLSESYTNEEEGFSFQYPKAWVPITGERLSSLMGDSAEKYPLILLGNENDDIPEENSYIMVNKFELSQEDANHLFVSDEEFAATFDHDVSIQETFLTKLDGVPARKITYTTPDRLGFQSYFYTIGSTVYRVDFNWLGENPGNLQQFFDAVIGSYTIEQKHPGMSDADPVISMEEAEKLANNWLLNHPLGDMAGIGTGAAANDIASINAEYFVLELWEAPREFAGLIYVRKADGYMTFGANGSDDVQVDLDDWYQGWASGENEASAEYLTLTLREDEGSWITLFQDGTFSMQVNLYEGYGTLSGTYTEITGNFFFQVNDRSFYGVIGDDVTEFEIIATDYGMEYRGNPIGTTADGSVYE